VSRGAGAALAVQDFFARLLPGLLERDEAKLDHLTATILVAG